VDEVGVGPDDLAVRVVPSIDRVRGGGGVCLRTESATGDRPQGVAALHEHRGLLLSRCDSAGDQRSVRKSKPVDTAIVRVCSRDGERAGDAREQHAAQDARCEGDGEAPQAGDRGDRRHQQCPRANQDSDQRDQRQHSGWEVVAA
jgi:hypothetical protein